MNLKPIKSCAELAGHMAHEFQVEFWSSAQYKTYAEAKESGAVSQGETCYGYSAYADAMANCCAVADRLCHEAHKDDIQVRVTIDGKYLLETSLDLSYTCL